MRNPTPTPKPAGRLPASPWLVAAGLLAASGLGVAFWLNPSMADTRTNPTPAPIDGERAYGYLKTICALGPRLAGSEANARQRTLVARHFETKGGKIREQAFTGIHPLTGERVDMVNLVGSWHPERTDRVLLSAHYDTRPHPDQDPDPEKRKGSFLGANDCASGVALLMEIANHLNDLSTPWGVDLVLFDGEELVYETQGEYFLGSKAFAKAYTNARRRDPKHPRYAAGLLFDMVGGTDLALPREQYSDELARWLVRDVWEVAAKLKATAFKSGIGPAVNDDHLPLNNGGIPTIDLIDFGYPHWHKADDLPQNCSGKSLEQVGRVVTGWLTLPKPVPPRRR